MKQLKVSLIICLLIFVNILMMETITLASSIKDNVLPMEYTEEFKKYLELTEEEKSNVMQPRTYEIKNTMTKTMNPFKMARRIGASLESSYTLKSTIPANVVVKNQGQTNTCWAFSALSSLETNLALTSGNKSKVYDFSERHMNYALTRTFANNVTNKLGVNRNASDNGNWDIALAYLTNGLGAVDETSMRFENNSDTIDISKIQNKKVTSEVYDTISFPAYKVNQDLTQIKSQIKEHIKNYGSIFAECYGANLINDYYNNRTGALYCDNEANCPINHGVSIVGWDDNFDKSNFNEAHRPTNNGAWIVKNSWGTVYDEPVEEYKKQIYNLLLASYSQEELINAGITDYTKITDAQVKQLLNNMGFDVEIRDNKVYMNVGKDGFMYISYEDVNIYSGLYGIVKANDKIDYDNIYQYDEFGAVGSLPFTQSKIYLANIFDKKTAGDEYLTQVSLVSPEVYTCKVYVNPNNSSTAKQDLTEVKLKAGRTETFGAGYHTIEFANPVKINGNSFAVVIEIQGTRENIINFSVEANLPKTWYNVVEIADGKCLISFGEFFENNTWLKLSELSKTNSSLMNVDTTIKAFTVSKIEDNSLKNIEITTSPTKTKYIEGENFDKTGMVVTANYNNGESKAITDYSISNGSNLKVRTNQYYNFLSRKNSSTKNNSGGKKDRSYTTKAR